MLNIRAAVAVFAAGLFLIAASPSSHDDVREEVASLHWTDAPVHLSGSQSTLTPPSHVSIVRDNDARRFAKIINGDDQPDLEAIAADRSTHELVYLDYHDVGYVTADDWKNVDTAKMLAGIKDNTDRANEDRKRQGISAVHVIGWVKRPSYDKQRNIVTWAISAREDGGGEPIVNSVALILGRHGYQQATWVGEQSQYGKSPLLDRVLAGDHYDKGARYTEFLSGDKLAGYGLAALVGTAAGATIAKTVGFGGLLLLLKKVWFLIAAGIVGAYRWFRSRFITAQS